MLTNMLLYIAVYVWVQLLSLCTAVLMYSITIFCSVVPTTVVQYTVYILNGTALLASILMYGSICLE